MNRPVPPADRGTAVVSRRTLLAAATWGVGGMALLGGGLQRALASSAPLTAKAPPMFMPVSRFLTGHVLDDSLSDRAWHAISLREADFGKRFDALATAISASDLKSMAQWPGSAISQDKTLAATALAIVSAWYLGRVGEMQERSADGPEFITYAGALMWRPTLDVTVIPTYARGKPGFWKDKPTPKA